MKILLSISYDGTNYSGWQRQTQYKSVQQEIEKAISKVYGENIKIIGASRTDAGVHALDQKAIFSVNKTHIPADKIYILINQNLPDDIVIISSEQINDIFNPLSHVLKKTYTYTIFNGDFNNPLTRNTATYIKEWLDVDKMSEAAQFFVGTFDFVAFCKNAKDKENTIRTVLETNIYRNGDYIYFSITGNGFLHNMVRTIMGVLVDVGLNKIDIKDVQNIILSKDRNLSSKVIAGNGLCLMKIYLSDF